MNVRPLKDEDKLTIAAMISRDEDHRAKGMTADFFYPQRVPGFPQPEQIAFCYEDDQGPVFYLRIDAEPPDTVRLHIQFDSAIGMARRTVFTLRWGFRQLLERYLPQTKCRRLVFDSISPSLRFFCERVFKFRAVAGTSDMERILLEPIQ